MSQNENILQILKCLSPAAYLAMHFESKAVNEEIHNHRIIKRLNAIIGEQFSDKEIELVKDIATLVSSSENVFDLFKRIDSIISTELKKHVRDKYGYDV